LSMGLISTEACLVQLSWRMEPLMRMVSCLRRATSGQWRCLTPPWVGAAACVAALSWSWQAGSKGGVQARTPKGVGVVALGHVGIVDLRGTAC